MAERGIVEVDDLRFGERVVDNISPRAKNQILFATRDLMKISGCFKIALAIGILT